mgnify:CR=1 FL=1
MIRGYRKKQSGRGSRGDGVSNPPGVTFSAEETGPFDGSAEKQHANGKRATAARQQEQCSKQQRYQYQSGDPPLPEHQPALTWSPVRP